MGRQQVQVLMGLSAKKLSDLREWHYACRSIGRRGADRWNCQEFLEFQALRPVACQGQPNSTRELFAEWPGHFNFLSDSSGEGCPGALISKEVRALVIFGASVGMWGAGSGAVSGFECNRPGHTVIPALDSLRVTNIP